MKKPYLFLNLFLLLIFFGCEQPIKKDETTSYPKNETAFIQHFKEINDKFLDQNNAVGKQALTDSGNTIIQDFIKKDLNLKIIKWNARVDDVKEAFTVEENMYDINVLIPLGNSFDPEHPTVNAITLKCRVKGDNKKLIDIAKSLKKFDKVLVSGAFRPENDGSIVFSESGARPDEYDFSMPKIIISLEDIVKQ